MSVLYQLEAIRKFAPLCRYYNAGSSEEFGDILYCPQDEKHPPRPRSPYGASKVAARQLVKVWRDSYNLYAVQGWLMNHEGVRRGEEFVTRKISKGVARIKRLLERGEDFRPIVLGNLEAKRDWSDAEDFVDGIWRMLNQEIHRSGWAPKIQDGLSHYDKELIRGLKEYVLSSNETHTIREFVTLAFDAADIPSIWIGEQLDKLFLRSDSCPDTNSGLLLAEVSPEFCRPAEVDILLGDSSLARRELNWSPNTSFKKLVEKMVRYDISLNSA
jgi:GDPmannose 4,6-dehydratase